MSASPMDAYIALRISKATQTAFMEKASRFGKPSEVHREIIEAFLDDRLVIHPDPRKESLYVVRTEN